MPKIRNRKTRTDRLNEIVEAFHEKKEAAHRDLVKLLPPGTPVNWTTYRSGNLYHHSGHVLWVGSYDIGEVRVRNERTGKESSQRLGRHGNLCEA